MAWENKLGTKDNIGSRQPDSGKRSNNHQDTLSQVEGAHNRWWEGAQQSDNIRQTVEDVTVTNEYRKRGLFPERS